MLKVMIVSGHNFKEQGCHNSILNISEYRAVQRIIAKVMEEEEFGDVDTVYKARNATLNNLPNEINEWNPDLIISVHLNAFNGKAQGTETLHWHSSKKGKDYATKFSEIASKLTGFNNRGTLSIKKGERGWILLGKTKAPAILIEPFFLDSIKTNKELEDKIQASARAIINFIKIIK